MNRGIKILGICAVAVGATVVIAPMAMQGMVADSMARRIEAATGVATRIGSARLGLFPGPHVVASDIRLGTPGGGAPLSGTIASLSFDLSFGSLIGAPAAVSGLTLDRPVLELRRKGLPIAGGRDAASGNVSLDGLAVNDGSFSYVDDRRQARVDLSTVSFRVAAPGGAGAPLTLTGTAALGGTPRDWRLSIEAPDALADGRESVADAAIGAPDSPDRVAFHGHLRLADNQLDIPDMAVNAGAAGLSGSGSVDFSPDAPLLIAALKVRHLDLDTVPFFKQGFPPLPADRSAVRLADAAVTLDIDAADAGRFEATAIHGRLTLANGMARLVTDATLSGGTLHGDAAVDAAQALPRPTLQASLSNVDVAPLLAGVAGTAQFAGRLDAEAKVTSAGSSRDELVPNLAGTARLGVHDAAITGVDVPGYLRSVARYLPPAWQRMTDRIDIQSLTASFQIAQGVATTSDFHAASPVVELTGTGDMDLNAQSFDLRFDPKIAANPAATPGKPAPGAGGLGVAILVQGPWRAPRLSADISNAMHDPRQTLDTLQNFGQQMLGGDAAKGGMQPDDIIKGLGTLFGGTREGRQASDGGAPRDAMKSAPPRELRRFLDAR